MRVRVLEPDSTASAEMWHERLFDMSEWLTENLKIPNELFY